MKKTVDEMIEGADKALYASKHNGRNQINFYTGLPDVPWVTHGKIRQRD